MRIIGGIARGKKLAVFSGGAIRPTPDRVREAVFNILTSRLGPLAGKAVLDLYAGTGAMALEALSRGASRAVLVDQGQQAAGLIAANLKACRLGERAQFFRADVSTVLRRLSGDVFDLVFLDPPYGRDLVPSALEQLSTFRLLAPAGLVCAETDRQDEMPDSCGDLTCIDRRFYGSTAVYLFTHRPSEA